jgi:hypothetical protein
MAGLVPAIHATRRALCPVPWMPGTSPRMTSYECMYHLIESVH